jgi:hypothetical protein
MKSDPPNEEEHRLWLHDCIKRYFEARGFRVWSDAPTTNQENVNPWDLGFEVAGDHFVKKFALQLKRPYLNKKSQICWDLDKEQHGKIQQIPWVYYGLPTFVDRRMQRVACSHFVISRVPKYQPTVTGFGLGYKYRWGGFVEALERCSVGTRLKPRGSGQKIDASPLDDRIRRALTASVDFTGNLAWLSTSPKDEGVRTRPPAPPKGEGAYLEL